MDEPETVWQQERGTDRWEPIDPDSIPDKTLLAILRLADRAGTIKLGAEGRFYVWERGDTARWSSSLLSGRMTGDQLYLLVGYESHLIDLKLPDSIRSIEAHLMQLGLRTVPGLVRRTGGMIYHPPTTSLE